MALPLLPHPRHCEFTSARTQNRERRSLITTSLAPQGYRIKIDSDGVGIEAGDQAGLYYAHVTIDQLARIHQGALPHGTVEDHPDILLRGVMLDISRDKVPRRVTLMALIDRLSSWKFNHVQLYI